MFEVPIETPSLTNLREHPMRRSSRAKRQRRDVYYCWRAQPDGPKEELRARVKAGGRLAVTLIRYAKRPLDDDNLRAALKHVRDEVAARLDVDDADSRVDWRYGQAVRHVPVVLVHMEALG